MFEEYRNRVESRGGNVRRANRLQSIKIMENSFDSSQTYRKVMINGEEVDARVTGGSSTTIRGGSGNYEIMFRDGVFYPAGTYVWIPRMTDIAEEDKLEPWLIMYDSDDSMFPRHLIKKCNYLLKWKNSKGNIIERWCVFSDNQRLINGERNVDFNKMMLSYYATVIYLPCDPDTINVTMDQRFLIDHPDIEGNPEAWIVRNRNVNSKIYDDYDGIIELSIARHQFNHNTDSKEHMVADYYRDYTQPEEFDDDTRYDLRIAYNGTPDLKMATPFKKYIAEFQVDGEASDVLVADWDVVIAEEQRENFTYEIDGNILKIKCKYDATMVGTHIRLLASNIECGCSAELPVKVVNAI